MIESALSIAGSVLYLVGSLSQICLMVLGLFFLVNMLTSPEAPADTSNRFNKWRLFWFVMTRMDIFVSLRNPDGTIAFPWLTKDEYEIVNPKIKDEKE